MEDFKILAPYTLSRGAWGPSSFAVGGRTLQVFLGSTVKGGSLCLWLTGIFGTSLGRVRDQLCWISKRRKPAEPSLPHPGIWQIPSLAGFQSERQSTLGETGNLRNSLKLKDHMSKHCHILLSPPPQSGQGFWVPKQVSIHTLEALGIRVLSETRFQMKLR